VFIVHCAEHSSDEKLHEPGSTATWHISPPKEETQGWRHIRYTALLVSFHRFSVSEDITSVCYPDPHFHYGADPDTDMGPVPDPTPSFTNDRKSGKI
jgi:hypothetical protein